MPRRKLLLADDSITIQKVVNLTFADEGIDVVAVGDGDSALEKIREDSPDIILADVNMPGLTGYEICAEIKSRDFKDQVPVVLLVGSFEPFDEDEAERVGADGYLTKPFQSISQLVAKVSELLGTSADPEYQDTAEIPTGEPEMAAVEPEEPAALDSGFEEPAAPAPTDSFDAFLPGPHPSSFEPPETFEPQEQDIRDDYEFEMSEAFGDDEGIEEIDPSLVQDEKIEEVSGDFLKTQPLTRSDIQEISAAPETPGDEIEEDDDLEAFEPSTETERPFSFGSEQEETFKSTTDIDPPPAFGSEREETFKSTTDIDPPYAFESEREETIKSTMDIDPPYEIGSEQEENIESKREIDPPYDFGSATEETVSYEDPTAYRVEESDQFEPQSEFGPGRESDRANGEIESDTDDNGEIESAVEMKGWHSGVHEPDLPQPEGASVLDLDELNLLELPPVEDEEKGIENSGNGSYEADSSDDVADTIDEYVEEDGGFASDETVPAKTVEDPEAYAASGPDSDDTLPSKELVESITQRVIETLSEKAIREIAWEVVPDLADLIIKKMAEEKMKK